MHLQPADLLTLREVVSLFAGGRQTEGTTGCD